MTRLRSAFTLVEVNLAIFIMAAGVLGMVSLYSLGFRESAQSRDDVAAAGYADAYFAPLVAGLSATNTYWSAWRDAGQTPAGDGRKVCDWVIPQNGWLAYVSSANGDNSMDFRVESGSSGSTAQNVFKKLMDVARTPYNGSLPSAKPNYCALVATRRGSVISLAFRSSRRRDQLMSQPLYYTEVHFQGDPNK